MPKTPMTFQFLDVGMGDGTLAILGEGATAELALIDLGVHPSTKFKIARDDAATYLTLTIAEISAARELPEPTLDHLFLTHPDLDHYNSVAHLMGSNYGDYVKDYKGKTLKVRRVTYGGLSTGYGALITNLKKEKGTTVDELGNNFRSVISSGTVAPFAVFQRGSINVYLLSSNYPVKAATLKNPQSLCLMFDNGGSRMLFMGDAEASVETAIVKYFSAVPDFLKGTKDKPTALKLGHHGSQAGTSDAWIKAVWPSAIFATGDFVWAHPYCPTIKRVLDAGCLEDVPKAHFYCCGVSGSEYTNYGTKNAVFLNLWYVVKDPVESMVSTDPDSPVEITSEAGTTFGVQWALDCLDTGKLSPPYPTDTFIPNPE